MVSALCKDRKKEAKRHTLTIYVTKHIKHHRRRNRNEQQEGVQKFICLNTSFSTLKHKVPQEHYHEFRDLVMTLKY